MKISVVLLVAAGLCASVSALEGTGASFPDPLYQKWFGKFQSNSGITTTYDAVGSSTGVADFRAKRNDFAGTDSAVYEQTASMLHFPSTGGAIIVVANVPCIGNLKLNNKMLTDIFSRKITKWKQVNAACPNQAIKVAVRSDGSGTTAGFTCTLVEMAKKRNKSNFWASAECGKEISMWTKANGYFPKNGNSGVANYVENTNWAIGYIGQGTYKTADPAFTKMKVASLQNLAGRLVQPTPNAVKAGLSKIVLDSQLRGSSAFPKGATSYPIVSYTWLLARKRYSNNMLRNQMKKLLQFVYSGAQQNTAKNLGYSVLPSAVITKAKNRINLVK